MDQDSRKHQSTNRFTREKLIDSHSTRIINIIWTGEEWFPSTRGTQSSCEAESMVGVLDCVDDLTPEWPINHFYSILEAHQWKNRDCGFTATFNNIELDLLLGKYLFLQSQPIEHEDNSSLAKSFAILLTVLCLLYPPHLLNIRCHTRNHPHLYHRPTRGSRLKEHADSVVSLKLRAFVGIAHNQNFYGCPFTLGCPWNGLEKSPTQWKVLGQGFSDTYPS